jgi:glycosyltransferase involved in cell wall biosynthesis
MRPYIQHAIAAVAPMRVARGVQNKVLEAMSMARPVLVSSKGLEGIDASHNQHVLLAEDRDDYVQFLNEIIDGRHGELGCRARTFVMSQFNWDQNLPEVVLLLGQQPAALENREWANYG